MPASLASFTPPLPIPACRPPSTALTRAPRRSVTPRRPRPPRPPPTAHHAHDPPQDSYLQCVECLAVYHVEPEEVEGAPRVVACSACLHEWLASDADLIWGHGEAVAALAAAARRTVDGGAFVAARGVQRGERPKNRADPVEHFNVFVGNLSFRATEEDLYRAFSGYGAVLSCQVPCDASGASRGFGFVEMRSRESAMRAMESLQGASILGRDVSLNEAKPRRERVAPRCRARRKERCDRRDAERKLGEREEQRSAERREERSGRVK